MRVSRRIGYGVACLAMAVCLNTVGSASPSGKSSSDGGREYWAGFGSGFASVPRGLGDDDGGVAAGASLSYRRGGDLLSLRWVTAIEFKLDIWGYSGPSETVWDVGLMYGRVVRRTHGLATLSAGAAVVGGSAEGRNARIHPGLPIEIQLFWMPCGGLGFGLHGFADFNSYKSFQGLLFCVLIGRGL